jgi:hypothetical protein
MFCFGKTYAMRDQFEPSAGFSPILVSLAIANSGEYEREFMEGSCDVRLLHDFEKYPCMA